jgi:brefeldin A-inhibited guanine nucleotide-exchange protein
MRSKLLSLHLVLAILQSHSDVFADPTVVVPSSSSSEDTPFLLATKQYLCLGISRNALSSVNQVFDLSTEIFWCMLKSLRAQLKVRDWDRKSFLTTLFTDVILPTLQKEIEVLFNEIYIPILEMRHATLRQKSSLLSTYLRLCQDPQALVDIYINYDCDRSSVENIYERLINVIGRLGQAHFPLQSKAEEGSTDSKLATFMAAQTAQLSSISPVGDSKITAKYAGFGSEQRIRRQALDGVITILRSLVEWTNIMRPPQADESIDAGERTTRPSHSDHRLSVASVGGFGTTESQIRDDPERFASARQQKTSLMEGIRDFNFKPKRVSRIDGVLTPVPSKLTRVVSL